MTTAPGLPFRQTREAILEDAETAALYLEEALAAGDDEAFKLALRHVAEARLGDMASLAEATGLNRETLYRTLSTRGNPTLDTLRRILHALGLRVAVRVEH
jgi:probable addiction module antidote protein